MPFPTPVISQQDAVVLSTVRTLDTTGMRNGVLPVPKRIPGLQSFPDVPLLPILYEAVFAWTFPALTVRYLAGFDIGFEVLAPYYTSGFES